MWEAALHSCDLVCSVTDALVLPSMTLYCKFVCALVCYVYERIIVIVIVVIVITTSDLSKLATEISTTFISCKPIQPCIQKLLPIHCLTFLYYKARYKWCSSALWLWMYQFLDLTRVIVCGTNQTAKLIKTILGSFLVDSGSLKTSLMLLN